MRTRAARLMRLSRSFWWSVVVEGVVEFELDKVEVSEYGLEGTEEERWPRRRN